MNPYNYDWQCRQDGEYFKFHSGVEDNAWWYRYNQSRNIKYPWKELHYDEI